ncbi:hypothetical protein HK104_005927 [Borealophlyctis nickersoniae]|nr:hypothetical protein HK104_005927 [Borealophlyctis nickersoniae]
MTLASPRPSESSGDVVPSAWSGGAAPDLSAYVLVKAEFSVQKLAKEYPPKYEKGKRRQRVLEYCCPKGADSHNDGNITLVRLSGLPIPQKIHGRRLHYHDSDAYIDAPKHFKSPDSSTAYREMAKSANAGGGALNLFVFQNGYLYDYVLPRVMDESAPTDVSCVEWYVNFADKFLFGNYANESLMATDEMINLCHPILPSLREAMLDLANSAGSSSGPKNIKNICMERLFVFEPHPWAVDLNLLFSSVGMGKRSALINEDTVLPVQSDNLQPMCSDMANRPTPILVVGAERKCNVDTGLGKRFTEAPLDEIIQKTTYWTRGEGHMTNFICMEAIDREKGSHRGPYTLPHLRYYLRTALTAFTAAVTASRPPASNEDAASLANMEDIRVIVHTGNWGCGEYGNNPAVIAFMQVAAARMAHIDVLVYHTFGEEDHRAVKMGVAMLNELWNEVWKHDTHQISPMELLDRAIKEWKGKKEWEWKMKGEKAAANGRG